MHLSQSYYQQSFSYTAVWIACAEFYSSVVLAYNLVQDLEMSHSLTLPQTLVGPVVYAVSCLCRSPKTEAQSSAEGWTGSVRVRVLYKLFCV